MSKIDMVFHYHRLIHNKKRLGDENNIAMKEETHKLLTICHIKEIQYPEWLAHVMMVKKCEWKVGHVLGFHRS